MVSLALNMLPIYGIALAQMSLTFRQQSFLLLQTTALNFSSIPNPVSRHPHSLVGELKDESLGQNEPYSFGDLEAPVADPAAVDGVAAAPKDVPVSAVFFAASLALFAAAAAEPGAACNSTAQV